MFRRLNQRAQQALLKARFIRPHKALIVFGLSSYVIGVSIAMYLYPEAYYRGITKTVERASRANIPTFARKWIYTAYAKRYGVNLEEVEKPLQEYKNLNQFFTRKLKPRPPLQLKGQRVILSPADCTVLSCQELTGDRALIVKDISYSVNRLLFELDSKDDDTLTRLKLRPNSRMYQVILYLSPGDYHRFHSPADIQIKSKRDIAGKLRPVNMQSILKNKGLVYEQNSRKVVHSTYSVSKGSQQYYMGLVFVAALNVSDTEILQKRSFEAGEELGKFNMGSTIVLLVEAEGQLKWKHENGHKLRFGEPICELA